MSVITLVEGRGLPLRGDDVDTDRIMPARFMKTVTFEGIEAHLFEDERAARPDHPLNEPRYAGASVLIVGRNFGCGSSREHAPQALYRRGIRAIVGESFGEIFFGNATTLGLPCVSMARPDVARLMALVEADPSTAVAVDLRNAEVRAGDAVLRATLPAPIREAFLSGAWDSLALLVDRLEEVDAVAARLPYLSGFQP